MAMSNAERVKKLRERREGLGLTRHEYYRWPMTAEQIREAEFVLKCLAEDAQHSISKKDQRYLKLAPEDVRLMLMYFGAY